MTGHLQPKAAWADEGTVRAGGKALDYACFGPAPSQGQAPTLVLLHEGLGSRGLWRDFPERLVQATGLGVLVFSRAGYGFSDPAELPRPLDYMTREAVDVLPEVLDAFGLTRCILVGHSDGATIAAEHAGSVAGHRVRGLVLMAPHFFTEAMGLTEIAKAREIYAQGDLKTRMAKHHADPDRTFKGWNDAWLDPGFEAWNVAEVIDYLRVPVLAIQGKQDQYGTAAQIDVITERSYAPVDVLMLEDCRHSPFLDQPEAVDQAIAEFCTRLQRIEAAEPLAS